MNKEKTLNKSQNKVKTTKYETQKIRISQICVGQIFGVEDIVNGRPATSTTTCISNKAVVYAIKADEFLSKMCTSNNEKTWEMIIKTVLRKDIQTKQKIQNSAYNHKWQ